MTSEVDGVELRLVSVLLPIRVQDPLGNHGPEHRLQRIQLLDWYSGLHRHPGGGLEFGAPGLNSCRAKRFDVASAAAFADLGQTLQILVDVPA